MLKIDYYLFKIDFIARSHDLEGPVLISEPYIYGYGRCLAPHNWSLTNMHVCNRVYVIYGGSGWYLDGGEQRRFLPGNAYILPIKAGVNVWQLPSDPLDHMFFDFLLTPPFNSSRIAHIDLSPGSDSEYVAELRSIADSLELLISSHGDVPSDVVRPLFTGFLQLLCLATGLRLSSDPRIEYALERIHRTNSDGSLDLTNNEELAAMLHIDVNHFIRIFQREVGVTPYKYILSHRLNMASTYISNGLSMTDASRMVGYESVSALSHALRRRERSLPAAY